VGEALNPLNSRSEFSLVFHLLGARPKRLPGRPRSSIASDRPGSDRRRSKVSGTFERTFAGRAPAPTVTACQRGCRGQRRPASAHTAPVSAFPQRTSVRLQDRLEHRRAVWAPEAARGPHLSCRPVAGDCFGQHRRGLEPSIRAPELETRRGRRTGRLFATVPSRGLQATGRHAPSREPGCGPPPPDSPPRSGASARQPRTGPAAGRTHELSDPVHPRHRACLSAECAHRVSARPTLRS
jgi:hypothetical protein